MYLNAIEGFVPLDIIRTFAAFLRFCYIARRNVITEDSLQELNEALQRFHEYRTVFSGNVRPDGLAGFSLPRQHSMVHYHNNIKNFGAPNGLCSSITESKHIAAVKRPWRRSSRYKALSQMLKVNERLDKLAAAKADFANRRMLANSVLIAPTPNTSSGLGGSSNHSDSDSNNGNSDGDSGNGDDSDSSDDDDNDSDDDDDDDNSNNDNDNNDGDNDGGDVGGGRVGLAGPLMNEVRLSCKRGKCYFIYTSAHPQSCSTSPCTQIPTNFCSPWDQDSPAQLTRPRPKISFLPTPP